MNLRHDGSSVEERIQRQFIGLREEKLEGHHLQTSVFPFPRLVFLSLGFGLRFGLRQSYSLSQVGSCLIVEAFFSFFQKSKFPELIDHPGETTNFKHVEYNGFAGVFIEAIKEQQQIIDSLTNELMQLRSDFELLKKAVVVKE